MADNVGYTPGTGATVAADDIGGALHQRIKLVLGADGTSLGDVGPTNPVPVSGTVQVSGPVQVSGTVAITNMVMVTTQASVSVSGVPVWMNPTQGMTILGTQLVSVVPGLSVSAQVSGTVSILPTILTVNTLTAGFSVNALVTGAVSVSAMPAVSISVSAALGTVITVLGTQIVSMVPGVSVNIGSQATGIYTTTATSGVTGPIVWFGVGQTLAALNTVVTILGTQVVSVVPGLSVSAQVLGSVSVSGTALVSMVAGGSISIMNVLNTMVTILSTVNVAIVAGAGGGGSVTTAGPSISATGQVVWLAGGQSSQAFPVFVSQINPPAGGGGSVTTAVPSVSATGQIMWIVGGQSTTAFPVVITGTVTAGAGTTVVSLTGSALVSGTVTVNGSVAVIPGVSVSLGGLANVVVTTTATSGVSGAIVWLGVGQTLAALNTVVTVLGTAIVSVVPGVSVNIGSQATGVYTTTATSGVTGPIVWLGVGQTLAALNTVVTVLGTQIVSVVPGVAVSVSAIAASQVLGTIVAVSGITAVSVLSTIVTILGTQIVSVASIQLLPVVIMVSSTVVGSSTTMLMTVYTGNTVVTTGASFWVVPAGKVFRVMGMDIIAVSSAVLNQARLVVIVGTAAASVSVVATVGVAAALPYAIQASTTPFRKYGIVADVAAATTIGVGVQGGTSHSILGAAIQGYLF